MMKPMIFVGLTAVLAACSGSASRLDMSQVQSELNLRAAVGSAMVRTVSLPTYAAAEELSIETPEGLIVSNADILWADDPSRAVTLMLTRNLGNILNAKIGPDPWPFVGLPDVSIDVRVTRMIAGADGVFNLEGQYFVGGDGIDYPNSTHIFAVQAPITASAPAAIADAQVRALLALSEQIAHKIAR
ncbi:MAG: membrane integrity-associated transporter subunit PqiC [Yoonia sp.]|nr:membrane integrity-associated transporter subunit PqiC [Yoonia sp.]